MNNKNIMHELRERCIEVTGKAPDWEWENIELAHSFFSDAESRELYAQEILHKADPIFPSPFSWEQQEQSQNTAREMLSDGTLPELEGPLEYLIFCYATGFVRKQYRYGNIVQFEQGERLYDCGACCGEISVQCALNGGSSVAFEPVPGTAEYLDKNAARYGQIFPVRIGVGDKDEQKMFNTQNHIGSNYVSDQEGDMLVELRRIDSLVQEYGVPTFIKMDLEGYEVPALLGARETISRYKPKLAVCLYHKPSDMWDIPLLLKQYVPEYRMYCKKSACPCEFVLFCVI